MHQFAILILSAYKKYAVLTKTESADRLEMNDIFNNNHLQ